jgi:sphingomyelin phosphodiesterase acid-like 3
MSRMGMVCALRGGVVFCALAGCVAAADVRAQAAPNKTSGQAVEALLVSDIHFEPFWDPAKVERLAGAPVARWDAILREPEAGDREERFGELQRTCKTRGVDTSYALYRSSLNAIKEDAGGAKFAILSGDLISHGFDCKFRTVMPKAPAGEYRLFVEKTIHYVMHELHAALPGVPVYAALGNNDTDCGDYLLDANSRFLKATGRMLTADVPVSERAEAEQTFSEGGNYEVKLPAPLEHTRLVVMDDLFMSQRYETCAEQENPASAASQIVWLEQRLDAARRRHEKVWVMAHIPPGVNAYATAEKGIDLCGGGKPQMFLKSEALPDAMAPYGDVIELAIFAHTHMDEMRLLTPKAQGAPPEGVAVKLVPSISPIDGNNPSFVVAEVDVATAELKDYRVIAASDKTGAGATWAEEYDFDKAYNEPGFTAATVAKLIAGFKADPTAQTGASQNYIRDYGSGMRELGLFWKPYTCTLTDEDADTFRKCVCGNTAISQ